MRAKVRTMRSGAAFLLATAGWLTPVAAEEAIPAAAFDGIVTVAPGEGAEELREELAVMGIAAVTKSDAAPVAWLEDGTALPVEADDDPYVVALRIADHLATLAPSGDPGDPDYGAYLAQECTSCHIAGGTAAVPGIDGIAPGYFRLAMAEYAAEMRDNKAMANVARSLGGEELAALAAHFSLHATTD